MSTIQHENQPNIQAYELCGLELQEIRREVLETIAESHRLDSETKMLQAEVFQSIPEIIQRSLMK